MTKRDNRSNHYQHIFTEVSCSAQMLAEFADNEGMQAKTDTYSDELEGLKDQLKKRYWELIEIGLTDRQKQVIKLYSEGMTQIEIARILGVNQSSITKSIHGNCDYGKNKKKIYGGSSKKLRKLALEDEIVQNILKRIMELEDGKEF